jgi:hypothetical protein
MIIFYVSLHTTQKEKIIISEIDRNGMIYRGKRGNVIPNGAADCFI